MKKTLSLVLVLALVLGSFGMVFAAPATNGATLTDINDCDNYNAIVANADLGIITGYEDGTFKCEKAVNRAEYAAMITRMLDVPDSALAGYGATNFTDMKGYDWAKGYIGFCEAKGIITGYGDGTFGPANTITVNEAITMTLRAVGYVATSDQLVGSWPSNYVTLGKRVDLYDDVAATAVVDRASAAQIIYNALGCEVVSVNADGDTSAYAYKTVKNVIGHDANFNPIYDTTTVPKTVIEVYQGCELFAGTATQTVDKDGFAIYTIDNAKDSIFNTLAYVGARVKWAEDDGDIVAIIDTDSTFLTGEYDADDEEFDVDGTIYDLDKTVVKDLATLENGVSVAAIADATALENAGEVTLAVDLSGKTIKEVYSVITWTVKDEAFFFEADMLEDDNIYGYDFATDDNNDIDTNSFILNGVATLADIAEDNIVEVYMNGNEIVRIDVATATVSGKVTKVDGDDYTIGGVEYTVAKSFTSDKDKKSDLKLKNTGIAYLNFNGDIVAWELEDATSDNYAVVTGAVDKSGRNYTIELVDKTGTEKEYVIDTADVKDYASFKTTGTVVTFALNSDGEIDELKSKNDQTIAGELNKNRTLYNGTQLESGVVIFTVDGDDYSVISLADLETEKTLTGAKVVMNEDGNKIAVMIVDDKYTGADSVYAVINTVESTINADDDEIFEVEGFMNGKAFTLCTDDEIDAVKSFSVANLEAKTMQAGVYKLTMNSDNVITDIENVTVQDTVANAEADEAAVVGYVVEKDGNYLIKVATTADAKAKDARWLTIDPNAVVYEYSKKDGEFDTAKLADIYGDENRGYSMVKLYQMDDDSETYDFIVIFADEKGVAKK